LDAGFTRRTTKLGFALFDLIRYRQHDERVFLRAFDLIELNGEDLRREALVSRKATLAVTLVGAGTRIEFNEHIEHDAESCSTMPASSASRAKRKDSHYVSGRSPHWIKMKNAKCEAVKREAEEEWGR
jgi:bifunctional non-homologous end joining protein LigD